MVEKYTFLHAGFGGMKSLANKKKYKVREFNCQITTLHAPKIRNERVDDISSKQAMKALESRETKGHHFIVADDIKNCPSFKSEAARRTIFSLLRHVKCVVEIRGPGSIVRYAAATNR